VRIEVRGLPAPQGSKRPVRLGNGRVGMVESSKAVGPWREAVRAETARAMRMMAAPFAGPVQVELKFLMLRPKGHYRTGRNASLLRDGAPGYPSGKPDLDKLARAVLDGLTAGGVWKDDSQVVTLTASKLYAESAGCVITVYTLEET
jgi:crossover junction endodeoxyribonuclease RusA